MFFIALIERQDGHLACEKLAPVILKHNHLRDPVQIEQLKLTESNSYKIQYCIKYSQHPT